MALANLPFSRLPGVADLSNMVVGEWTIYKARTTKAICEFDTFLGYSYDKSSSVPTNNIEQGSFAAYNKINNPAEFTVTLATSGILTVLRSMLDALEPLSESTQLLDIVLPFRTYRNVNITGMSHSITEGGAINTLIVQLKLREIKQTARQYASVQLNYGNVKNAGDSDTVNQGRRQAQQKDRSIFKGLLS